MKKIKVKGKWQYFDGDRRITEAEYNSSKKGSKKPANKKEESEESVEDDQE